MRGQGLLSTYYDWRAHAASLVGAIRPRRWSEPLKFPGPVLIVSNPVAGNGRGERAAKELHALLMRMWSNGEVSIRGPLEKMSTVKHPGRSVELITEQIRALARKGSGRRTTVFACGGDKTANVALGASARARQMSPRVDSAVVVGPRGIANDLRRIAGVPGQVSDIPSFLKDAVEMPYTGIRVYLDDNDEPLTSFHAFTWGISGDLFYELEKVKEQRAGNGGVSVADYVARLPGTAWNSQKQHFYVSVNGGPLIESASVFGPMVAHQLGAVTTLPLPRVGAKIYIAPSFPAGLVPFAEPFIRRNLILLGFQRFLAPEGRVYTMGKERQIDIRPGQRATMAFFQKRGKSVRPIGVHGTHDGDYIGHVHKLTVEVMEQPVTMLVDPHSELMVRQGLAQPRYPGDVITDGAVGRAVHQAQSFVNAGVGFFMGGVMQWMFGRTFNHA